MKRGEKLFLESLVPLLSVGLALFLTRQVPALSQTLFIYLAAVMVSAWFGGWFSGLLSTILSAVATAYAYPPEGSIQLARSLDMQRWAMFVLIALAISSLHASRTKAERAKRRTEQRLMLALDSAGMGVWDYNLLNRQFWASGSLHQIYLRTDDFPTTYGQFFALIHFDDQPMFNRAITKTIDEGTDYQVEHRVLLPDGSYKSVNTRGRVFFNERGRAERIVGIVQEVGQQHRPTPEGAPPLQLRPGNGNPNEQIMGSLA